MKKPTTKNRIIAALNSELENLYHNATIYVWGDDVPGCITFSAWLDDAACDEVSYLNSGGGVGKACYTTFDHVKREAAAFKSEAARARFLRNKRRQWLDERRYIESHIHDYGRVYSYGRGGRTLAPDEWTSKSPRSFTPKQYEPEEVCAGRAAEILQDVRAFNAYIKSWCAHAAQNYRAYCIDELSSDVYEKREELHEINREALPLIREIKAAGRAFSPAVCKVLTDELKTRLSRRRSLIIGIQSRLNSLKGLSLC